jgi:HEPN domain-containing protein
VDNAQLPVENAREAILMLFGIPSKTHEPAKQLAHLIDHSKIPVSIRDDTKDLLRDFLMLGLEEHFMTDYGNASSYTLPRDMFTEESAKSALRAAQLCISKSESIIESVRQCRAEE